MKLNHIKNSLTVKNVKKPLIIIFSFIWIMIFILEFKELYHIFLDINSKSWALGLVLFLFTFYLCYQLVWNLFGETTFTFVENQVSIRVGVSFAKTCRIFYKNKITSVEYISDVKTDTYWNFQGIRIYNRAKAIALHYDGIVITRILNISHDDLIKVKDFFNCQVVNSTD